MIEKYVYDAFGAPTITQLNGSTPTDNRFMAKGREYLAVLGLYDYRKRLYNPTLGVFLQVDPVGLSADPMSLYRFCNHNPLTGSDPMGEDDISLSLGINDFFSFDLMPYSFDTLFVGAFDTYLPEVDGLIGSGPGGTAGAFSGTSTAVGSNFGVNSSWSANMGFGLSVQSGTIGAFSSETGGTIPNNNILSGASPTFDLNNNVGLTPVNDVIYTGRITYTGWAAILLHGNFSGEVSSDATPAQNYSVTGSLNGVGLAVGYLTGDVNVAFAGKSPDAVVANSAAGGFWSASVSAGWPGFDVFNTGELSLDSYPTSSETKFGPVTYPHPSLLGVSTNGSPQDLTHRPEVKPGLSFNVSFTGINVQTMVPIPPPMGQPPPQAPK